MHKLNRLNVSYRLKNFFYQAFIFRYIAFNITDMQSLTRRIERNRFVFTKPKLIFCWNEDHCLGWLIWQWKLDLLVIRIEDFKFWSEKGQIVQMILRILWVLKLLKLYQGWSFVLDEYNHNYIPTIWQQIEDIDWCQSMVCQTSNVYHFRRLVFKQKLRGNISRRVN